jgi:alpha-tubulin suppressor-like RCC1 family protein
VRAIAAGDSFSLALKSDGSVVVWGSGTSLAGQAGVLQLPAALSGGALKDAGGVVSIAAGARHALARLASGKVVAWGDNAQGQTSLPDLAVAGGVAAAENASFLLAARNASETDGEFTGQAATSSGHAWIAHACHQQSVSISHAIRSVTLGSIGFGLSPLPVIATKALSVRITAPYGVPAP